MTCPECDAQACDCPAPSPAISEELERVKRELDELTKWSTVDEFALLRQGGKWLGAARSWLQWNKRNGDQVTWGSEQALEGAFTVREVEELAARVAAAAFNEVGNWKETVERYRKKCWDSDASNAVLRAQVDTLTRNQASLLDSRQRLMDAGDRIQTIADEANGPHPVLSIEDALTEIEQVLFEQRRDREQALSDLAAAKAEIERLTLAAHDANERYTRRNREAIELERERDCFERDANRAEHEWDIARTQLAQLESVAKSRGEEIERLTSELAEARTDVGMAKAHAMLDSVSQQQLNGRIFELAAESDKWKRAATEWTKEHIDTVIAERDALAARVAQAEREKDGMQRDRDRVVMDRNREIDALTARVQAAEAGAAAMRPLMRSLRPLTVPVEYGSFWRCSECKASSRRKAEVSHVAGCRAAAVDVALTSDAGRALLDELQSLRGRVRTLEAERDDLVEAMNDYVGNDECAQYDTDEPIGECSCRWCVARRAMHVSRALSPPAATIPSEHGASGETTEEKE